MILEQKVTQAILVQLVLPEKKEIPEQPVKQVLKVTPETRELPETLEQPAQPELQEIRFQFTEPMNL